MTFSIPRVKRVYTLRIPGAATRPGARLKKRCIKDWRILISLWKDLWDGFFYVSNLEEFSFCRKRQYSYNERNTLKFRGNCERNFDRAFSSSFEITFFWVDRVRSRDSDLSFSGLIDHELMIVNISKLNKETKISSAKYKSSEILTQFCVTDEKCQHYA